MRLNGIRAAVLFSSLSACAGGDAAPPRRAGEIVDSASGTVALGLDERRTYRAVALSATGSVAGTISLQGVPDDSAVATGKDATSCGDTARVTETGVNGSLLSSALVWVDGVTSGKPLPELRRQTLTIERCRFEPRVIGVVAGSTINVLSRDRVTHDARFYREGSGAPVAHVHTVDAGQVVPSEKIASAPGIVEARCALHPWTRGYVAVFEHPYFAVTDAKGAFEIDGLAPGTYSVKVWHEGLDKPMEQRVMVGAGGVGRLDVAVTLR